MIDPEHQTPIYFCSRKTKEKGPYISKILMVVIPQEVFTLPGAPKKSVHLFLLGKSWQC